ncbi:MAG: hypothetical protein V3T77_03175 [Planctomycetota bacterium]
MSEALEHKVPSVARRIQAMGRLAELGWKIGLRFDPLIYHDNFRDSYSELFRSVFAELKPECIHSVSLGPLRFPKRVFDSMVKLYPHEPLLAGPLEENSGLVSTRREIQEKMLEFCRGALLGWVPETRLFPCAVGMEAP